MTKQLSFAGACILLVCTAAPSQDVKDPDRAIELFEGAVGGIRSFDVSVQATMRFLLPSELVKEGYVDEKGVMHPPETRSRKLRPNEKPGVREQFSRQVYRQGKGRIEILDRPGGTPTRIATFDAEIGKTRDVGANEAVISKPVGSPAMTGADYRDTYRSVYGGITFYDLVVCLRQRKGHVAVKGPTADSPLFTLEAPPVPRSKLGEVDFGNWGFRVALDPRRGMMPARIEVLQPVAGKLELYRRTTVNEWKDIGNGVWVPVKATTHVFRMDSKNKELHGELANEIVLVVDVVRSTWNKEVGDKEFWLALPAGTKVTDTEREVRYVTGKPDPGKNLDDLAANARQVVPITVARPAQEKSWLWSIIYASLGLGGIAVVSGVGLYYRRRRLGRSA